MRKFLTLSLLLGSMAFGISSANAAETSSASSLAANAAAPQVRIQIGQNRRWNRRPRVVTQVRTVRAGGRIYRETYRITYFANGRTRSQLISRARVR